MVPDLVPDDTVDTSLPGPITNDGSVAGIARSPVRADDEGRIPNCDPMASNNILNELPRRTS